MVFLTLVNEEKSNIGLPAGVVHIETPKEFNELVEKYASIPIILDFWAPWCGPCNEFTPIFEEAQKTEWGKKFVFAKLNAESPAKKVADALDVSGIPTIIFIKNMNELHRHTGALKKREFYTLLEEIQKALNSCN
jgi:thioredoxin 2